MTRVLRVSDFIIRSQLPARVKIYSKIARISLYMLIYLHINTCINNIVILQNGPTEYILGNDDFYHDNKGQIATDPIIKRPVENSGHYLYFGEPPTFASHFWHRLTKDDSLDWQSVNNRWDQRSTQWYSPSDWVSFNDQQVFTPECTHQCRYFWLLYYSLISFSSGELSPVNSIEYGWFVISLLLSIFMFSFFFGNVTSLIMDLNFNAVITQNNIDEANTVMSAIETGFESKSDVRMFFKLIEHTQQVQNDFDSLLYELPHSCIQKVISDMYIKILSMNHVIVNSR